MYPPLGILYLAAYVRKQFPKINIKITDGFVEGWHKTIQEVNSFPADLVGISSATPNASGAFAISRYIKKTHPETAVILGGIHATSLPKQTLEDSFCDIVALGEGEKILTEIVKKGNLKGKVDKLANIPGIVFKEGKKYRQNPLMPPTLNLDDYPFPARDLVNLNNYDGWTVTKKRPETSIFSTRGCPFHCHFCSNRVWKLQPPFLRLRSPKNVMDEIEELSKNFGIQEYFDHADEINAVMNWTLELCREKIRRKLKIPWKAMIRADNMTKELARLMARSNLWYVHLGIESGNQETLQGVNKKITLEQVINCCRILKKEGIKICGLFMLFNVWENKGRLMFEDIRKTINTLNFSRKLLEMKLIDNFTCSQATPYPGSLLYDTALKYNLIRKKYFQKWELWNHSWSFVIKLPGIKLQDQIDLKKKAVLLQNWQMIKNSFIPWGNLNFVLRRGFSLAKRFLKR